MQSVNHSAEFSGAVSKPFYSVVQSVNQSAELSDAVSKPFCRVQWCVGNVVFQGAAKLYIVARGVFGYGCASPDSKTVLLPGVCLGMGVLHLTAKLGIVARGVFGYGCASPDSKTRYCCHGYVWVRVCFT